MAQTLKIFQLSPQQRELLARQRENAGMVLAASQSIPPRANREGPAPLSYAQEQMWLVHQLEPDSTAYNFIMPLRLQGPLDVLVLERAVSEIVRRHEVTRTHFLQADGQPMQVVDPPQRVGLPLEDLSGYAEEAQSEMTQRSINTLVLRRYDLARGPLVVFKLLRLARETHVLLMGLHHIAMDGWSGAVFSRELKQIYEAFVSGQPSPLPELSVQYADFAVWQRQALSSAALREPLAYWRRQLAGAPAALALPSDRPRPDAPTHVGAWHRFTVTPEIAGALREFSRREGVSLFMTLLAAFQVFLRRMTGEDDLIVGSPIAGRDRSELTGLLGYFLNTLALRTDLSGDPSFHELLVRVREVAVGAYAHAEAPFECVVKELHPGRSANSTPFYQVMLAVRPEPDRLPGVTGLQISEYTAFERPASVCDLTLNFVEKGATLRGHWEYSTELFDAATVARWAEYFQNLLRGILSAPEQPISRLPFLDAAQRKELLSQPPVSPQRPVSPVCIHTWFETQAALTPENVAVVSEGRSLNYRQLNARANFIARTLRQNHHIGPDDRVGVLLERSEWIPIALLGILKAGAAYVPLDPLYPPDRMRFMLEDAGCKVVLTQAALAPRLAGTGIPVLEAEGFSETEAENLPLRSTPDNLAYVIYTSGSTGRPKGVLVTHANVARLFTATQEWFHFGADDVWTLFHSYAFDFSVWELWGALLYGGKLVVVPYLVSRAPDAFYRLLAEQKVTVLNQTPSAFKALMQAESSSGPPASRAVPSDTLALRWVIFGGEALHPRSLQPWFEAHGAKTPRLVNMYGITETTVHVTFRPLGLDDLAAGASVIGVPIPDLQLYILDSHLEPTPVGVAGELYVGGAGLARGYLNRPELTAERFIADPFGPNPGGRLYKSGDLARRLSNGEVEYLGRADQQVKIRGFRVELGEIEAVLCAHPAVAQAALVVREEQDGQARLVAYLVGREGQKGRRGEGENGRTGEGEKGRTGEEGTDGRGGGETEERGLAPFRGRMRNGACPLSGTDLREFLKEKLPDYMVPADFVRLDRLPLTSNGKLDRRALPAPERTAGASESFVAPRNPAEERIAAIWCDVLQRERVSVHDNFFDLGGHSLLAMQVINRIRKVYDTEVPVRTLFQAPTVAALAERLGAEVSNMVNREETGLSQFRGRMRNGACPLSGEWMPKER